MGGLSAVLSSRSTTSLLPSARGVMGDFRMVHALGLETPSRRLLDKFSEFQVDTWEAYRNHEPRFILSVFTGVIGLVLPYERWRERERDIYIYTRSCLLTCIYTYIYIHVYVDGTNLSKPIITIFRERNISNQLL